MSILEVLNITKKYKKTVALNNVSLKIKEKTLTCLVGPDGAGKSTLLKILSGVLRFDSGKYEIFGEEINKVTKMEHLKDAIAFMPQGLGLNLYQNLSIEENIDFFADLHGLNRQLREKRKYLLLKATGLENFKDRQVSKLSGGMKQKLGICCALIHSPKIIILDEPTTGVDPISRRELYKLLHKFIAEEGVTAIVSTSYMDEAERGDSIFLLFNGKIIFDNKNQATDLNCYEYRKHDFLDVYNNLNENDYYFVTLGRNYLRCSPKNQQVNDNFVLKECNIEDKVLQTIGTRKLGLKINKNKILGDIILSLENVTKRFGNFYAVKNATFNVLGGEIIGLLGPNGAGKTTLMKILLGLYQPSSGNYKFYMEGKSIKENIGYMSQKFSLYNDLTVRENLKLNATIRNIVGKKLEKRLEELYEIGNLKKYKNDIVEKLPLGIKQRLALMCSIVHEPVLVFLDEPTSGVDIAERDAFWQIIRYLSNNKNTTFIVSTHFMNEADFCDKICLMNNGYIVEYETPDNLREKYIEKFGQPYSTKTDTPYNLYEMLKNHGYNVDIFGNKIKIFLKDINKLTKLNLDFKKDEVTIEDVFVGATENVEF